MAPTAHRKKGILLSVETITIELSGSYAAFHKSSGTQVDTSSGRRTYKDPLPPLCRILRDSLGYPSETRIRVERARSQVFKRDLTLAYWADYDVIDAGDRSTVRVKYRPFEGVKSKKQKAENFFREIECIEPCNLG